jgi:predicted enzyme related to lactoylglutathione lyase
MLQCETQGWKTAACRYNRLREITAGDTCTHATLDIEHIENEEAIMRQTGKLDYMEMPATGGTLDSVKAFYAAAFSWTFTDYGPTYSAFGEGLDGGFQADSAEAPPKPLPVLYSDNLEETVEAVEKAGGTIIRPIFSFPGGRRFHFLDPAGNELAVWSA